MPFGRGEYLTYDLDERYVPLNSAIRVQCTADVMELVGLCRERPDHRAARIAELRKATEPNFQALDDALNGVYYGRYEDA